jgi:hypothetical protein
MDPLARQGGAELNFFHISLEQTPDSGIVELPNFDPHALSKP